MIAEKALRGTEDTVTAVCPLSRNRSGVHDVCTAKCVKASVACGWQRGGGLGFHTPCTATPLHRTGDARHAT